MDGTADAKRIIADRFRDPASVQFRDVRRCQGNVVQGEANGKNAYGAYVGFQQFMTDGNRTWLSGLTQTLEQAGAGYGSEHFDYLLAACYGKPLPKGRGKTTEQRASDYMNEIDAAVDRAMSSRNDAQTSSTPVAIESDDHGHHNGISEEEFHANDSAPECTPQQIREGYVVC